MILRIPALALLLIVASLSFNQMASAENGNAANSKAITPCVDGRTAPSTGFWSWPANTVVNIYLRQPDFSAADVSFVKTAVTNWDNALTQNGSTVRFIFHGLTSESRMAQNEMTIIRKVVSDKKGRQRAILEAHSRQQDRFIDYALLLVDPGVKNPETLTNVVAHELGHSLGLMDCYKCENQTTAMGMLKRGDQSNGIEGPSSCDTSRVMTAYAGLTARVPRGISPVPALSAVAMNQASDNSKAGLK